MKTLFAYLNTRHLMAMTFAILGLLSASTASAQTSDITPEVRKELEAINHRMEDCILKKDFSTLIDFYTDDATIMVAGGKKIQGRKEIAEYWYALSGTKSLKSEILELGGNGKIVYQVGRWTITTVKDGVEHATTTDVVLVWKRQQNYDYKIQLNSSNNPVASIGSPAAPFEAAKT
jgi:ketosteroid isomerase-like protein